MEIHTLPSYREVVETLDTFHNLERAAPAAGSLTGGTERMAALMARLGSPQASIPAIHIAGTKGKGSVSSLISAALSAAGIKTGLYTSPHVTDLRERIQIGGRPVGEQRFTEACAAVLREAETMRSEGISPSWFEILTATAFMVFKAARAEAMILETGLGGRLDATNLPDIRVAAVGLSSISMDHQEILGNTLEAIASEKAAIIRPNTPLVTVPQAAEAGRVITERARELNAPVFRVGKDVTAESRRAPQPDKPGLGQRLDMETWRSVYPDIPLAMLGRHQAENAALALGLTDLFLEYMDREALDSLVLRRAWRNLALPARLETVAERPHHIVDGAHNPASAWAAAETILENFAAAERTLIFGAASDKDWQCMLRILAPLFRNIIFVPFASQRSTDPAAMAAFTAEAFPGISAVCAADAAQAAALAAELTPEDGLILTAGSLWLAGEIRALCRKDGSRTLQTSRK